MLVSTRESPGSFGRKKRTIVIAAVQDLSHLVRHPADNGAMLLGFPRLPVPAAALSVAVLATAWSSVCRADEMVIKRPGEHPHYVFEAEPHGLLGFWGPFAKGAVGAGFRGTVVVVDDGFISSINDSVGITFGGDFFFGRNRFYIPVALQWNFWLSRNWSVFGEPGVSFSLGGGKKVDLLDPLIMGGARLHLGDTVALTLRAGYPAVSVGVSFLL